MVDVDPCYELDISEDEKDDPLTKELNKKIKKPVPGGEFLSVQLGDDLEKFVKIDVDLLEGVKEKMTNA